MTNNNFYPMTQYNTGYGYAAPRPQARNTQPLTKEQIEKLKQNSNAFSLKIDQEDIWRGICTHKEKNGHSALVRDEDGSERCLICGAKFNMYDASKKEVEDITKKVVDVLQTVKTLYVDASEELVSHYFQLLPLIEKIPQIWELAVNNFSKYESMPDQVNQFGPRLSGFDMMNRILTPYGGMPQQPYGYAPQYNPAPQQYDYNMQPQPQTAPQYNYGYQQPMAQPMADPYNNPMAYGAPAPVSPQAPVPGTIPAAPQPMVAPTAPEAAVQPPTAPANPQGEVQQQATFNV